MNKKVVVSKREKDPGCVHKFKAILYVDGAPARLDWGIRCGFGNTEYAAIEDLRSASCPDVHELPMEYQ